MRKPTTKTINCKTCGKATLAKNKAKRFCSGHCSYKDRYIYLGRRKGKEVPCDYCGNLVYKRPWRLNTTTFKKVFCNKDCFNNNLKTNVPQVCVICGSNFYCSKSQVKYRNRKTCSMKCRGEYASKYLIGERSSFWRGGVSSINKRIRYSKKMGRWRKSVFERDNYTCQQCFERGGKLEAHHIKPFAFFPDERFNLNNGLTLCRGCHDKTKLSAKVMYEKFGQAHNITT